MTTQHSLLTCVDTEAVTFRLQHGLNLVGPCFELRTFCTRGQCVVHSAIQRYTNINVNKCPSILNFKVGHLRRKQVCECASYSILLKLWYKYCYCVTRQEQIAKASKNHYYLNFST